MNSTASAPARTSPAFCIAGIALTGIGLIAAGLRIKWGAAPPPGDALRSSWLYVNFMLLAAWLIFWPAWKFSKTPSANRRTELLWQWISLAIGAIPALAVSAFLAGISFRAVAAPMLVQAAFSLFAAGLLGFSQRFNREPANAIAAMALASLALAGPVLLFIGANFFPQMATRWAIALPAICLFRELSPAGSEHWLLTAPAIAAACYAMIGLILLFAGLRK